MNSTTKYILLALGGGATVLLIVFLINRMRRIQAAKRLRNQDLTNEMLLIKDNTINGTPDWNNSKVIVSIAFGPLTWTGEINPTTNKSETRGDQEIKITGGAQSAKIELILKGTTVKTAEIDFYNEKLNGFN